MLFLFLGLTMASRSPFGVEKLIFRAWGFFSVGTASSSRPFGFLPLFAVCGGAGAGAGTGSGATGAVFVRLDPRVKTKSPSSSSYATREY